MRFDKAAAIAAILAIAITATLYPRLPAKIPVHWGLTGKPDRWGPPMTIFLPPVIALIANFYTMGDEKYDLRARTRKVRLVTGGLMALQTFALWWTLTKMAG
ncbi:MAG: DUF1648 domain-containing protein [Bacillota bacterium]